MTVTFQTETWDQYYNDPSRHGLWQEHYEEFKKIHLDRMEMNPDVGLYQALDKSGALSITVARKSGTMIGYCLVVVRPHIHYSRALCGFEDSYFVTMAQREGLTGYKLLAYAITECKRRGCLKIYFMTKEFNSIELLLTRLEMVKEDSVFAKWLR